MFFSFNHLQIHSVKYSTFPCNIHSGSKQYLLLWHYFFDLLVTSLLYCLLFLCEKILFLTFLFIVISRIPFGFYCCHSLYSLFSFLFHFNFIAVAKIEIFYMQQSFVLPRSQHDFVFLPSSKSHLVSVGYFHINVFFCYSLLVILLMLAIFIEVLLVCVFLSFCIEFNYLLIFHTHIFIIPA